MYSIIVKHHLHLSYYDKRISAKFVLIYCTYSCLYICGDMIDSPQDLCVIYVPKDNVFRNLVIVILMSCDCYCAICPEADIFL